MNSLFKNMTYVILDFCQNMTIDTFSIGYTSDERKIRYYRNIIKYSFINYTESEVIDKNDGETYFIYKV